MTQPVTINITLDLDAHLSGQTYYDRHGEPTGTGPTTLEDVILDAAARHLVDRVIARRVDDQGDWYQSLGNVVTRARDEAIAEQVGPMVAAAVDEVFTPTNTFGESTCAPTTLRSEIVKAGKAYLEGRDPNRGRQGQTRLQAIIEAEVGRAFTQELAAAAAAARAEVLAAVQAKGAETLAATIAAMAKG